MASGQLSTRATVALILAISLVAVSSERSSRLVGAHVCGSRRDRCCRGWRASESRRCTIPVCANNCSPGGTCIQPGICRCADGSLLTRCSFEPDLNTRPRPKRMADGTPHVKYTKKNSFEGPCSSTACDHICETLPDNSYKCSCRQGYLLHANRRYCTLATFTGWTGDQHTRIASPTNSGQQRRDDRRGSGRVFGPPNAGGESPDIWDLDSKDRRFTNGLYAFFPSPKPGVVSPGQKLKESYEPKDGEYTNDGQVDPEDQMWYRAEGKGDQKSQNKEAVVRPDQDTWVKDLEQVKMEELSGKRKQKDPVAEDVWEMNIKTEKTKMEVQDIAESQNSDSLYDKQWKQKTEYFSGGSMAKLREDRKGAEDTDDAVQLKDEEKKYLEEIEWAKKELEKKENEKKENEKKYNEKKGNNQKAIEKKISDEREDGKKENVKKENEKKYYEQKENKKKDIEMKLNDERENGKKKYEKKEHGKKVIGKGARDDKARRRLVSLVESPKFHNHMPIREENAKKAPKFETDKKYPSFPVDPKAKAAGKNKAKKDGKAYPTIPKFLWPV